MIGVMWNAIIKCFSNSDVVFSVGLFKSQTSFLDNVTCKSVNIGKFIFARCKQTFKRY